MSDPTPEQIAAARAKMAAKMGGAGKIGGKGTVRRKQKSAAPAGAASKADDKQLHGQLKKMGMNQLGNVEEVNMFTDKNEVIHFAQPTVYASVGANTYAVSGQNETKPLGEMLPKVLNQIGLENMMNMQKFIQESGGLKGLKKDSSADADIPDVEGTFEDADVEVD